MKIFDMETGIKEWKELILTILDQCFQVCPAVYKFVQNCISSNTFDRFSDVEKNIEGC